MGIQFSDCVDNHSVFKSCQLLMHLGEYLWSEELKELQENMEMCTGHCKITEVMLKMV